MHRFAALCHALDASTDAPAKVAALRDYFQHAPAADAAWAVQLLAGSRPRRQVPMAALRELACQQAGLDDWLFDACLQAVGDLAETINLVLPASAARAAGDHGALAPWLQERLPPLRGLTGAAQAAAIAAAWQGLDGAGRLLAIRLMGGGWRVDASRLPLQRALAEVAGLDSSLMAQRLAAWAGQRAAPSAERYAALLAPPEAAGSGQVGRGGQPHAFVPTQDLQAAPDTLAAKLGAPADWRVTWLHDGLRAQVIKRDGRVCIWLPGDELVSAQFPELLEQAAAWPDGTVIEGELLVWRPDSPTPAPFKRLQQRLDRKTVTRQLLADAPVRLLADELIEATGIEQRPLPRAQREAALTAFATGHGLRVAPALHAPDWAAYARLRASARAHGALGLRLRRDGAGLACLTWRADPSTVDAVLVYAEAGLGRHAGGFASYTFAVWSRAPHGAEDALAVVEAIARGEPAPPPGPGALQLLPVARISADLGDDDRKRLDATVRAATVHKFGPVRSLRPDLVAVIGFDGASASPRHKSGLVLLRPRILGLRTDQPVHLAGTLAELLDLSRQSE